MTEQQWRILRALAESEPRALEPRQICDLCTLSSPSLTGVLARMDELGLVARRRVDADQRRLLVSLTPKSRAIVRRMAPLVEREYQALEAAVGRELVRDAYALLDRMSASLRATATRDERSVAVRTFGAARKAHMSRSDPAVPPRPAPRPA